jgi:hypothetical protein
MKLTQIFHKHVNDYKYFVCITKPGGLYTTYSRRIDNSLTLKERSWSYQPPNTDIFNSFYLELIK